MAILTANEIADYILWMACQKGDLITNLKLQKLVYYAQAWYLAINDEPLFNDPMQAWIHGPVQYELWQRFKDARWKPINCDPYYDEESAGNLPKNVKEHLNEIIEVFFRFSAYDLERMTHQERPWINARKGLAPDEPSQEIIRHNDMKSFYRSLSG